MKNFIGSTSEGLENRTDTLTESKVDRRSKNDVRLPFVRGSACQRLRRTEEVRTDIPNCSLLLPNFTCVTVTKVILETINTIP